MKFIAIIDGKKEGEDRIIAYISNDNDPVPFVVDPPNPDEAKDAEPPKPKPKPS